MLTVDKVQVTGFEAAIRGMRNPMNSWDKSDSKWVDGEYVVGPNDIDLMHRLCKSGSDHRKFMRMLHVSMDINAPLYWWKEWDTYKVGTVSNSCSTMHKIHSKEFTLDDFSHDQLHDQGHNHSPLVYGGYKLTPRGVLNLLIAVLNGERDKYLETKDKLYWRNMIELLPSSYNQLRTVDLNYENLHNIYHARKNHKLTEWHTLCDAIEKLPLSELITAKDFEL